MQSKVSVTCHFRLPSILSCDNQNHYFSARTPVLIHNLISTNNVHVVYLPQLKDCIYLSRPHNINHTNSPFYVATSLPVVHITHDMLAYLLTDCILGYGGHFVFSQYWMRRDGSSNAHNGVMAAMFLIVTKSSHGVACCRYSTNYCNLLTQLTATTGKLLHTEHTERSTVQKV
jgi:hypothetical protein